MIFLLNHFTITIISTQPTIHLINFIRNNLLGKSTHLRNITTTAQNCLSLLHHLGDTKQLNHGKPIHSILIKTGLNQDVFTCNNLIRFYSNFGDLLSAHQLFDEIPEPNLVSWTSMISSYVHDGRYELGFSMFSQMCRSGFRPNEFGFSVALKACRIVRDFVMGESLHGMIVKCGFEWNGFCSAAILAMYVESGDLRNASKFFDGIPLWGRSEALWNTLLDGYAQICDVEEAFKLFHQMKKLCNTPNCYTYTIMIKLCLIILDLDPMRLFHCCIVKVGLENDTVVGGTIVDMYGKVGCLVDACKVFWNLEERDNVAWCALLAGFLHNGEAEQGLKVFLEFLIDGNKPDLFTFASVFSLCSKSGIDGIGAQVHCSFIKYGFVLDSFMGCALIDMYGNIGMIYDAYLCFSEVENRNEICFSAMIHYLVLGSVNQLALELFYQMMKLGLAPSNSTLSYILRACANLRMLRVGKSLHSYILKNIIGFDSNSCIENALIELYAESGLVHEAKMVFEVMTMPNEFSWTTIISGCYQSGGLKEALELFRDMFFSPAVDKPSQFTVVPILQACVGLEALDEGRQVHGYVIKVGYECYPFVGSALISMYAAFKHEIQNASLAFSSMNQHDLVSWSTMITAFSQNGCDREALKIFTEFQCAPIFSIDESILSSCLSACAGLASLAMGKWFHACSIKTGFESYLHVASSIIDMYSKCGNIKDAHKFFRGLSNQNIVSWTAMMSGYAHHGLGSEAVELFDEMKKAGLKPDGVTFIGVLTACSHSGLLKEGWQYFESMRTDFGMEVTLDHYACMVDLLGRLDQLDAAEALIIKAPLQSKTLLWKILLGACNTHGNIEKGNQIAQMLIELRPNEPSNYVLLSNIYAAASMWDNKVELRNRMKEEYVSKEPGYSWLQAAG